MPEHRESAEITGFAPVLVVLGIVHSLVDLALESAYSGRCHGVAL